MNNSVILSAIIASCAIVLSFTALAQQVSSSQAADCTLTVSNRTDAPAAVGVTGGDSMVIRPGSQGMLHAKCMILQKTAQNYRKLIEKQSDTSYSMSLIDMSSTSDKKAKTPPSIGSAAPAKPASAAPAKTTKLKSDNQNYIWVSSSANICMSDNC